jgi:dihydrodipicolinate synthase/N-acetylneuraminate lyase
MIPTPFTEALAVDMDGLRALVDFATERFSSIAILGFGAECLQLSDEERRAVTAAVCARVDSGTRVVVGCTALTSASTLELVRDAADAGASVLMVAPPLDVLSQDAALAFLELCVAYCGDSALMVQDAPAWSGAELGAAAVRALARAHADVVKFAKPEALPFADTVAALTAEPGLSVYTGLAGTSLLDGLALGARGSIPFLDAGAALQQVAELWLVDPLAAQSAFERLQPLLGFEMQTLAHAVLCSKLLLIAQGLPILPVLRMTTPPSGPSFYRLLRAHASRASLPAPPAWGS